MLSSLYSTYPCLGWRCEMSFVDYFIRNTFFRHNLHLMSAKKNNSIFTEKKRAFIGIAKKKNTTRVCNCAWPINEWLLSDGISTEFIVQRWMVSKKLPKWVEQTDKSHKLLLFTERTLIAQCHSFAKMRPSIRHIISVLFAFLTAKVPVYIAPKWSFRRRIFVLFPKNINIVPFSSASSDRILAKQTSSIPQSGCDLKHASYDARFKQEVCIVFVQPEKSRATAIAQKLQLKLSHCKQTVPMLTFHLAAKHWCSRNNR